MMPDVETRVRETPRFPDRRTRLMASAANLKAEGVAGVQEPLARRMLPRVDRREIAAIFAGGALGTLARAALVEAFPHPATAWPWPTFGFNIAAAFLLGTAAASAPPSSAGTPKSR